MHSLLDVWEVGDLTDFRMIQNPDSIQYTNYNESIVIYLSGLILGGSGSLGLSDTIGTPKINEEGELWHFKCAKRFQDYTLICVITVTDYKDIGWARDFFTGIRHEKFQTETLQDCLKGL